jgi:hypothetical protein
LRRHKAHDVGFGLARGTSIPPSRFSTDRQRSTGRNDCANLTNPAAALVVKARSGLASPLDKPPMPKKPGTNPKGEFAFFNVVYEDDSVRSNRRVPNEILGGLKGDEPARGFIMEQDREIAQKSGRPALSIKRIERVGAKKK